MPVHMDYAWTMSSKMTPKYSYEKEYSKVNVKISHKHSADSGCIYIYKRVKICKRPVLM